MSPPNAFLGLLALAALVAVPAAAEMPEVRAVLLQKDPPIVEIVVAPATGARSIRVGDQWQHAVILENRSRARFALDVEPGDSLLIQLAGAQKGETSVNGVIVEDAWASAPPSWAAGATWYNIFPERFDNGDPSNDPCGFFESTVDWDSPWFDVDHDTLESAWARASAHPRVYPSTGRGSAGAYGTTVFQRRYGGDLQGVVRRLDHIKALGCDAIWFCPVFASPSLHKYDTSDHRHIDPAFGPVPKEGACDAPVGSDEGDGWGWTPADRYFVDVVLPECKKRGIRVIIDGVWNHVGLQHFAFRDVQKHGRGSHYASWFDAEFETSYDSLGKLESWSGWGGRKDGNLPEFHQENGDLAPGVKDHVFRVTQRWMDPNGDGDPSDGIDGWRLDVANEVGRVFWNDWRQHVKAINPEALIVGELWFDGREYFDGTAFDSQMNYPFAFAITAWLTREPGMTTADLADRLRLVYSHHPATDWAQMNLLGSHDTQRLVSILANPGFEYDRGGGLGSWQDPEAYLRERPPSTVYDLSLVGLALQVTLPGSPMVFAGDEWGMYGADDPENRKPIPWPDTPVDDADRAEPGIKDRYAAWLSLRTHPVIGPALRFGTLVLHETDHSRVFAFERRLNDVRVLVVANAGESGWAGVGDVVRGVSGEVSQRSVGVWVKSQENDWTQLQPE